MKGSMKEIFTGYYKCNYWGSNESASGSGSELDKLKVIKEALPEILSSINTKSLLDIPCGDFNWMKTVDMTGIKYIGADIVEELITDNAKKYKDIEFKVLNICESELPKVDVIFVRDCLVHLSNADIYKALNNIVNSGSGYLLTTTFSRHKKNKDIKTGFWRPLNLQRKPFNFPAPEILINEGFSKRFGRHSDKSLGLWKISTIEGLMNSDRRLRGNI